MERTKLAQQPLRFSDAINCSISKNFTQIPNTILRDPTLSGKAKALLCLLLSNKEGWRSYISSICRMMKEGEDSIRMGVQELEQAHYLIRIQCRDKTTKQYRNSFWAYTDLPGKFDLEERLQDLEKQGLEGIVTVISNSDNPYVDYPELENTGVIIHNTKNTNSSSSSSQAKNPSDILNSPIKKDLFDRFWKIYPRKVDKGKAQSKWNAICNRPKKDIPTWRDIKLAIILQKKSDRWQDTDFIPHPTTWLNQNRWLDDPAEMKNYNRGNGDKRPVIKLPEEVIEERLNDKTSASNFITYGLKPALALIREDSNGSKSELAVNLCDMRDWYLKRQNVPAFEKTPKPEEPAFYTYCNWKHVPRVMQIIEDYVGWLQQQGWLDEIQPRHFKPDGKVFQQFLTESQREVGINFFTGESID